MPDLYVARENVLEDAMRYAVGEHGTWQRWSTTDGSDRPSPLNGYVLYGFGPGRDPRSPAQVLWFVLSQTYAEPTGVRVDALDSEDGIEEIPNRYPHEHDQTMVTVWLTLGLADALRSAFRRHAQA